MQQDRSPRPGDWPRGLMFPRHPKRPASDGWHFPLPPQTYQSAHASVNGINYRVTVEA
jgi:hypothetical protein